MSLEPENEERLATLGGRMRAVRLARGLTTDAVAKALHVSRPTVTTWELGHVDTVKDERIKEFAALTDVSSAWLKHGRGKPPAIPLDIPDRAFVGKRADGIKPFQKNEQPISALQGPVPNIVEISSRPKTLAAEPQASWSIPREVLTLGFNCDPDSAVVKRAPIGYTLPDGVVVSRGDYMLIDSSRNDINEPGMYFVADPSGKEVKRVFVSAVDGGGLAAKMQGSDEPVEVDELEVLGRAMAVFRAL